MYLVLGGSRSIMLGSRCCAPGGGGICSCGGDRGRWRPGGVCGLVRRAGPRDLAGSCLLIGALARACAGMRCRGCCGFDPIGGPTRWCRGPGMRVGGGVVLCRLLAAGERSARSALWPSGGKAVWMLTGRSGGVCAASLLNGGNSTHFGGLNWTAVWSG